MGPKITLRRLVDEIPQISMIMTKMAMHSNAYDLPVMVSGEKCNEIHGLCSTTNFLYIYVLSFSIPVAGK